ncbi:globin domain-containing protein [Micrococcus sp. FDAARGOS_333]|uniref:globin domain-containing protein n=1 Tax=Micrococcus sp. FDAARGOS_333 TaxID=1930558 RepID=UPI000B4E5464|nr:globin domain-containing protein [Micrococcus sp. FDAARGOS_333]PNL17305.1 hemin transporter [Micrococcus sp. FDAARGOS_333]
MLSEKSRPVIEATAEVVAAHMDEITPKFYAHMFEAHPELLNGVFSRANQRNGEQPKALSGSIVRFAVHLLEHPNSLPEAVLSRIAHKHASLGITEDQYQIVYENLFWAISDTLGDAVTDEVAEAWTEVYWLMADALIKLEKGLYAKQANTKMWTPWRVESKDPAGASAFTFRLVPADDTPATVGEPGQYVSVRLPVADGLLQARQYSLSSDAASADVRVITVKRDDDGEVSPVLHDSVQVGDILEVSNPYGDLTLATVSADEERPLVLATAGIGITPAAAILQDLAARGSQRRVAAFHADRSAAALTLADEVRAAVDALPQGELHLWLDSTADAPEGLDAREGRMDFSQAEVPQDADVVLCGPLPFMQAVRSALIEAGVPATQIHYEIFGPDLWLAA